MTDRAARQAFRIWIAAEILRLAQNGEAVDAGLLRWAAGIVEEA